MSTRPNIAKNSCQYRLNDEDLYRCISYEALKIEGVTRLVHRIWGDITDTAIIFVAGHYDRYSGKTGPTIPYIDPQHRFKHAAWVVAGNDVLSHRLLNKFGAEEKHKYDPERFIRLLTRMIFHTCIRHFNTTNQHALADAMSADLCPITIHWYDDMVLLEITDGRDER